MFNHILSGRNDNMTRKEEIAAVKKLGVEIGYGNLMDIASGLWALLEGHPMHVPTVEEFMTATGKSVALQGVTARVNELKSLGYH